MKKATKVFSCDEDNSKAQPAKQQPSNKDASPAQKSSQAGSPQPQLKHSDSKASNNTLSNIGHDDGIKVDIKRKGSGSGKEVLKRKISDADMKMPKKATKLIPEMFDDLIYGNEPYPEIEYHMLDCVNLVQRRTSKKEKTTST